MRCRVYSLCGSLEKVMFLAVYLEKLYINISLCECSLVVKTLFLKEKKIVNLEV